MKFTNGKYNKALVIGIILYCVAALDITINTLIAHIANDGLSKITNAIMVGPFVVNPLSVSSALVLGTVFVLIGLVLKSRNRRG